MDGGWIIETKEDGERLRLWVCDSDGQEAAVLVLKPPGPWPVCGDEIRWRRGDVIWRRKGLPEVVIPRLCFSFDPRPTELGTSYR